MIDDTMNNIHKAREALQKGDYDDALELLENVNLTGQYAKEAEALKEEIHETEIEDVRDAARAPWMGFALGVALYLLIALRSPLDWTTPGWIFLGFVVVPGIVGYYTAWLYGFRCQRAERFKPSALAGGMSMLVYTFTGLIIARSRIAEDPKADVLAYFLVGLIVIVLYSLISALVAGTVGAVRPYAESDDDTVKQAQRR